MSFAEQGIQPVRFAIVVFGLLAMQACASAPADPNSLRPTTTANAGELTRITNDPLPEYWPKASPDGTMLLFNQRDDAKLGNERFNIIRMNIGTPARTLVTDEASSQPSWFPDNRSFAYETGRTGTLRIVRSIAAGGGGGMTFLTNSTTGTGEESPDVASDGRKIVFVTTMRSDTVMATVEIGSSNVTVYGPGLNPKWSPDGTKIAYQWIDRGTWQIFVMDLEMGAQVTQLTSGQENNEQPAWSPDGQYLTFISDRDGNDHVFYVRNDGTGITQLTLGRSEEQGPSWSSDGLIYFASDASGDWDVWRMRPVIF